MICPTYYIYTCDIQYYIICMYIYVYIYMDLSQHDSELMREDDGFNHGMGVRATLDPSGNFT